MTSVRTYSIEKERAMEEIQRGFKAATEIMAAGIDELAEESGKFTKAYWEGEKEVEERMAADVTELRKDADKFAVDFWEGE